MSRRNDPTGIRTQRIQKMHKMIEGAGDVDLTRLLAMCSYTMGLTRETSRRYLKDLEDLGFIEVDEAANVVREVVKA